MKKEDFIKKMKFRFNYDKTKDQKIRLKEAINLAKQAFNCGHKEGLSKTPSN